MWRWIQKLGLAGFFVLAPIVAQAGHYVINTKTSGLSFSSPSNSQPTFGYGAATGNCGGGGSSSATMSGSLSTTFSWVKDLDSHNQPIAGDTAPSQVIIVHTCKVVADATGYPSGASASANNGCGATWTTDTYTTTPIIQHIPSPPYQIQIGTEVNDTNDGTMAEVKTGGDSVVATLTPHGTASCGSGPYSLSITYSVAIYPVTADVTGCKVDPDTYTRKILPGSPAVGALSSSAPDITFSAFTWDPTSEYFKTFEVTTTTGHAKPLDSGELAKASPTWKWTGADSANVQVTATASYKGTSIGGISATRAVSIVAVDHDITYTFHNPPDYKLINDDSGTELWSGTPIQNAIDMSYHATPPASMVDSSPGTVGLAQTVTWYFMHSRAVGADVPDAQNTTGTAHDGAYPYQAFSPATSVNYPSRDNPWVLAPENPAAADTGISGNQAATDYIMYIAPASGSSEVALMKFSWTWSLTASYSSPNWSITTDTCSETSAKTDTTTHPDWTSVITNIHS